MLDVLFKTNLFGQIILDPVHDYAYISASFGLFKYFLVAPLPAPYNGCKDKDPAAFGQCHFLFCNLIDRLPINFPAALRTMRNTDFSIQEAKIVIYLRNSSDSGAGIVAG